MSNVGEELLRIFDVIHGKHCVFYHQFDVSPFFFRTTDQLHLIQLTLKMATVIFAKH
jgi:hypothetical protein